MKKLLILAGMPGSGKTYFLNKAYENNIRIFGEEHHDDFLKFMKAGLVQGDPTNEDDMNRLNFTSLGSFQRNKYPPAFVYHVDLLGFYFKRIFDKPGKIHPIFDTDVQLLVDKKRRQELVLDLFNNKLDAQNSIVCVNSLDNGFDVNRKQFMGRKLKRRKTKMKILWPLWRFVYSPTPFLTGDVNEARRIHRLIKECWIEDMKLLGTRAVFNTRFVDGKYEVERI